MIFSVFQKIWVFGYSWSTLLWYRCYYSHRSRDALSPVSGIFSLLFLLLFLYLLHMIPFLSTILFPSAFLPLSIVCQLEPLTCDWLGLVDRLRSALSSTLNSNCMTCFLSGTRPFLSCIVLNITVRQSQLEGNIFSLKRLPGRKGSEVGEDGSNGVQVLTFWP